MLDFEQMFHDHVDNNQKEWSHDRNASLGASGAFDCLREQWFKRFGEDRGFETDPGSELTWGAMKRGDIMEDHFVVPVLLEGLPPESDFLYGGDEQMTFEYGRISATPDGLITNVPKDALAKYGIEDVEGDSVIVEIKSIDPRVNLEEEKTVHYGQAQIQMGLIRRMTEYKPMYAVIIYVDASFYDDILIFPVRYDPNMFKNGVNRANHLYAALGPSEIKPEGKLTGKCKYCQWTHACAKVNGQGIPENEEGEDHPEIYARLDEQAEKREELKAKITDLEIELDNTNSEIKESLTDLDRRKAKTDFYRFNWSFQKGRQRIDTKQAEADGVDLEPYKSRGAPFEQLRITRLK